MKGLVFTLKRRKPISKSSFRKSLNAKHFFKTYGIVLFFTLMLIIGLTLGSLFFKNIGESTLKKLDVFFVTNITDRLKNGYIGAFCASFASNFLFLLFAFLMGFSLWGMALLPVNVLFKGFGIGISAGFLFTNYSFKGIIFYLIILLPGIFLFSMALVYQSSLSFNLGKRLVYKLYSRDEFSFKSSTKIYLQRSFLYFLFTLFASVVDMSLWGLFGGLFKF